MLSIINLNKSPKLIAYFSNLLLNYLKLYEQTGGLVICVKNEKTSTQSIRIFTINYKLAIFTAIIVQLVVLHFYPQLLKL